MALDPALTCIGGPERFLKKERKRNKQAECVKINCTA